MKLYKKLGQDTVKMSEYITEKLGRAVQAICDKTGNRFYHSNAEYQAVKGIILTELMEEVEND
jgi:hypothetical protein